MATGATIARSVAKGKPMKKALIWLSVGLNVLVLSVVILAINGALFDIAFPLIRHWAGYTVWADAIGERVRVPSIPNSSE